MNLRKMTIFASLLLMSAIPVSTMAADIFHVYVDAKGKDSNSGLDAAHPLLTLQKAHSIVAHNLTGAPRDAIVHIAPGRYYGQVTRWSFSMPNNSISIQGDDPNNLPVFVGTTVEGQATWMTIARGSAKAEDRQNIQLRNIKVTYYFQAMSIRGGGTNYLTSAGGNLVEHMIFTDIGAAFDSGPAPSHAAVFITESDFNVVRYNRFDTITNDAKFPADYSTYGGLHAMYVIHSNHTIVQRNKFIKVYARGVIKFRDFSNYGKVIDNTFMDDTSLLMDSYCDASLEVCASYGKAWNECPSWDILWQGNQYKYSRPANKSRPTVDISFHPANEAYCLSDQFFVDRQLDPNNSFNHPMHYYPRYKDIDNVYAPNL